LPWQFKRRRKGGGKREKGRKGGGEGEKGMKKKREN